MIKTPAGKYAIVRGVPTTYDRCVKASKPGRKIDVNLARSQHALYCRALEKLGLTLVRIDADDRFPDCCFVEDPAIVLGTRAVITQMGIGPRRGEETAVANALAKYKKLYRIRPPATIEGGDVLKVGRNIYIGLSERINLPAIRQVRKLVPGCRVIPVKVRKLIHLKTGCTYLGSNYITLAPGYFDEQPFAGFKKIIIPSGESYSANCLAVNGKVLVPAGYDRTRKLIEKAGFETVPISISEFRKSNGGLTCLSIIF